jgi:broad specificity phosphatase PhoE
MECQRPAYRSDGPSSDPRRRRACACAERPAQRHSVRQGPDSGLQRARSTCSLAGFGDVAEIDNDLVEWDYGKYEGLRSPEIRAERPDWDWFRDGAPRGECPAHVVERADNIWRRVRAFNGNVLLFSSGHFILVLAVRWIGLPLSRHCNSFVLGPCGLSAFGYDLDLARPVIRLWNDMHHISAT